MDSSFSSEDLLDVSIDLTPLIDTVFMLLIFFIMATTFSKPVLEVVLQEASGAHVIEQNHEPLTISINKEGLIVSEDKVIESDKVEEFIKDRPKDEGIIFNVDKDAPFGTFVLVLDIAKKYGKENFAITTATKNEK